MEEDTLLVCRKHLISTEEGNGRQWKAAEGSSPAKFDLL